MTTFCENCRTMVDFTPKNTMMEKEVKGRIIQFEGKEAYCPTCNCGLFVPSLRDYNLKQLEKAFSIQRAR